MRGRFWRGLKERFLNLSMGKIRVGEYHLLKKLLTPKFRPGEPRHEKLVDAEEILDEIEERE